MHARPDAGESGEFEGRRGTLGTGNPRKFAQALLEYFDAARVTRWLPDDRRVLGTRP